MYDDVITGAYDSICEQAIIPEFIPYSMYSIEKTFNALRMIDMDPEMIETIIYETDEIWSERNMHARVRRFFYNKEQPKHRVHVMRKQANHGHGWRRW